MGIENIYIYVNYRIINWSNTKFFELTSKGLYEQEVGRITDEILEVKGLWTKEGLPSFVTTEEHPPFDANFKRRLTVDYVFVFLMTLFLQTLISGQSWNAFSKSASSTAPADAVKKTNDFNNYKN